MTAEFISRCYDDFPVNHGRDMHRRAILVFAPCTFLFGTTSCLPDLNDPKNDSADTVKADADTDADGDMVPLGR